MRGAYVSGVGVCPWCAGHGYEPAEEGSPVNCLRCSGLGWGRADGDLGSTRSAPSGRPFWYDPGTGTLAVTGCKRKETRYRVEEFVPDAGFPGRAFRLTKLAGDGEVRNVFACRDGHSHICDCPGSEWRATSRADARARERGEACYDTRGCVHLDAVILLLRSGWLDVDRVPVGWSDPQACPFGS